MFIISTLTCLRMLCRNIHKINILRTTLKHNEKIVDKCITF